MKKDIQTFQGARLSDVPKVSGIYAWYYSPNLAATSQSAQIIASLAKHAELSYELSLELRYGLKAYSRGIAQMGFGSERVAVGKVVNSAVEGADEFFDELIGTGFIHYFTRPMYIGIAKCLYRRVYKQHYEKLCSYWDATSSVSRFMDSRKTSFSVNDVMKATDEPHSFALEARVREIPAHELMAVVYPLKTLPKADIGDDIDDEEGESQQRRAIERVLQLITDPICGRK